MATPGSGSSRRSYSETGAAGSGRKLTASGTPRSGNQGSGWEESPGMYYEVTRLRNELRSKDRDLEEKLVEIRTLKTATVSQDKAIEKLESQLAATKDRLLGLEGDMLSIRKQLSKAEAERDVYKNQVEKANREADRLNEALALIPQNTGIPDEVRRLEQQVSELRQETDQLSADNKACYNVIRAKEKELSRQSKKLAEAEEAMLAKRELDNIIADLRRQLGESQAEVSTLQKMQRLKDAEVADAERDANKVVKELQTTSEYLASVTAELQMSKSNLNEARAEISVLRDELSRVSAVASRVARAELRGGSKDEGTIPVMMHLEEVKYMQGEIQRLKQQLELSEKSVRSAQLQKERLYKRIDALALTAEAVAPQQPMAPSTSRPGQSSSGVGGLAGDEEAAEEDMLSQVCSPPQALVAEMRGELTHLRESLGLKEQEAALLAEQLQDRVHRLDDARGSLVKMKGRLCELLGDDAYMREFGEPPPAPGGGEEAQAEGAEEAAGKLPDAEEGAPVTLQAVAASELQRVLQELSEKEAEAASWQAAAQQAQQEAAEAMEKLQQEGAEVLEQQLEEARGEVQQLQQQLHEAESLADAASGEVDSLQQQLVEERAGAEQRVAEARAEAAAEEQAKVEEALAEAHARAEVAAEQVAALQRQLEESEAKVEQLEMQLAAVGGAGGAALPAMEDLQRQLEEALAGARVSEEKAVQLQDQVEALKSEVSTYKAAAAVGAAATAAAVGGLAVSAAAGQPASAATAAAAGGSGGAAEGGVMLSTGVQEEEGSAAAGSAAFAGATSAEAGPGVSPVGVQEEEGSAAAESAASVRAAGAAGATAGQGGEGGLEEGVLSREEAVQRLREREAEVAQLRALLGEESSEGAEGQNGSLEENGHSLLEEGQEHDGEDGAGEEGEGVELTEEDLLSLKERSLAATRKARKEAAAAAPGMTPEALSSLVERLVDQREAERRQGGGKSSNGALFNEMTVALKAEMARLGKEMIEKEEEAEQLRSEVGSLKSAKLTAEAVASRLEEMNQLSMRVAALKLELSQQESEHEFREAALLHEVTLMRKKLDGKKKSPTKILKKTISQAAKGFRESLSHGPGQGPAPGYTPEGAAILGSPPPKKSSRPLSFSLGKRRDTARASTPDEAPLPS